MKQDRPVIDMTKRLGALGILWGAITLLAVAVPATAKTPGAETPRDTLIRAAFTGTVRADALRQVMSAEAGAIALLARDVHDREAQMTKAIARSYIAKLRNSRSDALAARLQFEALAAADPKDPEAQAAIGGWHIESLATLGSMVARMALGARKAVGIDALDRSVVLGGNRAMFTGLAALLRAELDPGDPRVRPLAEAAVNGTAPTALDRTIQKSAAELLMAMKTSDAATIKALCKRLLPFGRLRD